MAVGDAWCGQHPSNCGNDGAEKVPRPIDHHSCQQQLPTPPMHLEKSHGGVGTLPAPILNPARGNKRHVTREKLGTLASEHKEKCAQLIAEIARQSVPDQWRT